MFPLDQNVSSHVATSITVLRAITVLRVSPCSEHAASITVLVRMCQGAGGARGWRGWGGRAVRGCQLRPGRLIFGLGAGAPGGGGGYGRLILVAVDGGRATLESRTFLASAEVLDAMPEARSSIRLGYSHSVLCFVPTVGPYGGALCPSYSRTLAPACFLPRMRQHVPSQVPGLRERLAARLAGIRPLPRMRPQVHSQVAGRRERLAARLAYIRPLHRMRPQVQRLAASG